MSKNLTPMAKKKPEKEPAYESSTHSL